MPSPNNTLVILITQLLICASADAGDDWPMWRFDSGHTAASDNHVPQKLSLLWSRNYGRRNQVWDDPLNHDMMTYDRILEPVVKDGRMFLGFNDSDKVVALDLITGKKLWQFFTGGPVRFSPVAWEDRVFFTSDDGHLYAVNANDGSLIWKIRGGPSARKVLGNERIIGAWPARGGPVVADDIVYFAASIWPFMGTFIYAIDADTGKVIWVNDGTAADYKKQPHSSPSFAGVGPQGTMVVSGNDLIVPGGRSVPAVFNRETGALKYFDINTGGKGNGGSFVIAIGDEFYLHTRGRTVRQFHLEDGDKTAFTINEPVLTDDLIFSAELTEKTKKPVVRAYARQEIDKKTQKKIVWEVKADGQGDLILASDKLFAAGNGFITPIALNANRREAPAVATRVPVAGEVQRLLAANDRLIAVTLEGQIQVFGSPTRTEPKSPVDDRQPIDITDDQRKLAEAMVKESGATDGYLIWYEAIDAGLLAALVENTVLHVDVVNKDATSVDRLRRELDAAGLYGNRISVHVGTPTSWQAPPFIASAVIVGRQAVDAMQADIRQSQAAYESVRPYGGRMLILHDRSDETRLSAIIDAAKLENAQRTSVECDRVSGSIVTRVGALTGAANWTHQYGDVANTVKSDDSRVKLPLGVLWFGGSSNMDVLPRHGHGPPEQVVDGRLYIEGMQTMNCRDVYTGRILWQHKFEDLGTHGIYYDETYTDTPLELDYNQVHLPGANGRGSNYVVTGDAVYIAVGCECIVLDAATGETIRTIGLPKKKSGDQPQWGFIGVYGDVLLAGNDFARFRTRFKVNFEEPDKKLKGNKKGFGSDSYDASASAGLMAFDRHTGKQLWAAPALHGFVHNGIVAGGGKVYCLDKLPLQVEKALSRRGKVHPETYRIVAFDIKTGQITWENSDKVFGTWLSYSNTHDLLLQAGATASDRLKTEVGAGMAVHFGASGKTKWRDDKRTYTGPCILHHDTILTSTNSYKVSSGAFSLLDGKPILTTNPLTGEEQPWQVCRAYGCNNIIASEHLLTFRSGAAGYYDLKTKSGTGNLGGFKSGCTSNLIVANGVLNAPDYTRTCICAYQNQTSLGLIHMPDLDMWTVNQESQTLEAGERFSRIGINFGAPGDRMDETGTLWVDYPLVGGKSADLNLEFEGDPAWYRTSSSKFSGEGPAWIGSSGVMNATRITIPMAIAFPKYDGAIHQVLHQNDDAEEDANGNVNLESSDLEIVGVDKPQVIGIRFRNIDIPRGTNIRNAFLQFTVDEAGKSKTELTIQTIDAINPPAFKDETNDVSSRPRSKTKVVWKPAVWKITGDTLEAQRTPDLAKLISEHIDRQDWVAGKAIGFIITGHGERCAKASEFDADGPLLIIDADVERPEKSHPMLQSKPHTVRLHFADPQPHTAGQRLFAVSLQGKRVIEELDIAKTTGQPQRTLVREFKGIDIGSELTIDLKPISGQPIISGVEIVEEE